MTLASIAIMFGVWWLFEMSRDLLRLLKPVAGNRISKRRQNPKRPLLVLFPPNGYSIFNTLLQKTKNRKRWHRFRLG